MTASTRLYRVAAHVLGGTVFNTSDIESVCVRRSVATGEAAFPISDLDLDIAVPIDTGAVIGRALRRLQLARIAFPRTGQCFVTAPGDLDELADLEPYRASINRRSGIAVRGHRPEWPDRPIDRGEAARRVVFWLDSYFPGAVRSRRVRLQRKCRLEMRNALGILDRRWGEPRLTQAEVQDAYPLPRGRSMFADGLESAGEAHAHLGRTAPSLTDVVRLEGLTVIPSADAPWPHDTKGVVVTPAALDLLLQSQRPSLWLEHGPALAHLGFAAPSDRAWIDSAWRLASVQWLRGPGFFEPRDGLQEWRLAMADHILGAAERGNAPGNAPPRRAPTHSSAAYYYASVYDGLVPLAATLRSRARKLGANGTTR